MKTNGAASASRNRRANFDGDPATRETRTTLDSQGIKPSTVSAGPRGSVARRGGNCVAEPRRLGVHSPGTTDMPAVWNSPRTWVEVWEGHGEARRRAMYWRSL